MLRNCDTFSPKVKKKIWQIYIVTIDSDLCRGINCDQGRIVFIETVDLRCPSSCEIAGYVGDTIKFMTDS